MRVRDYTKLEVGTLSGYLEMAFDHLKLFSRITEEDPMTLAVTADGETEVGRVVILEDGAREYSGALPVTKVEAKLIDMLREDGLL